MTTRPIPIHWFTAGLYRLMQFARVKSIGRVSRFTLTQAALLRGLEAGNRLEEILSFPTEASKRSLPQNIAYSLRDWAKGYKEARVSSMLLIELLSDTCEADHSRALADLGVEARRLSPGVFALAEEPSLFTSSASGCSKKEWWFADNLMISSTPLLAEPAH